MSDDIENEVQATNSLIEVGSEITGNIAGAAVGFMIAGPAGMLAGAMATPVISRTVRAAAEFAKRQLGHREEVRVGAAIGYAVAKIQENLSEGKSIRDDSFFNDQIGDHAAASEIFEGVLLAAQRDHEEKKLRFYGNLLANIAFHSGIDRYRANHLIKLAQQLSYRQICLVALFARIKFDSTNIDSYFYLDRLEHKDIIQDLYSLSQLGVLQRIVYSGSVEYVDRSSLSSVRIDSLGEIIYRLMEPQDVNDDDLYNSLFALLQFQDSGIGTHRERWESVIHNSNYSDTEKYDVRFVNDRIVYLGREVKLEFSTYSGKEHTPAPPYDWLTNKNVPLDSKLLRVEQPKPGQHKRFYTSYYLKKELENAFGSEGFPWLNDVPGSFVMILNWHEEEDSYCISSILAFDPPDDTIQEIDE